MALYELAVIDSASVAMSVRVDTGIAFARGYYLEVYSSAETLVITAADPTNQRINRVVVRCGSLGVSPGVSRTRSQWREITREMAPAVGLEPTTKRLTAARSTTELRRSDGRRRRLGDGRNRRAGGQDSTRLE
jgi:hypothetical protein